MTMKAVLLCVLLLMAGLEGALCWDQEELDLFDLVEEVEENFYSLLQVEQSSSPAEIKRAFRQLSLKLHPDKNDDPDATETFRKLVAVAEVLKDEKKRAWYDLILIEGLPDWRQPIYYYRRVRKMGLLELSILLLVIASVAHYLYGWAVFAERQLVLQEVLSRKQKKERKSTKSNRTISLKLEAELEYRTAQVNESIPKLKDVLPILLAKNCFTFYKFCLSRYSHWKGSKSNPSVGEQQGDQQEKALPHRKRKPNMKRTATDRNRDRSDKSVSKTIPSSETTNTDQPKDVLTDSEATIHVPAEEDILTQDVPGNGIPGNDVLGNGVPGNGVLGNGVPGNGVLGNGVPGNGVLGNGVPGNGVPGNGVLGNGVPGNGVLGNDVTSCFEIGEETVWSGDSESESGDESQTVPKDSDSGTETMSDERSKVIQNTTSGDRSKDTQKSASSNRAKVVQQTTSNDRSKVTQKTTPPDNNSAKISSDGGELEIPHSSSPQGPAREPLSELSVSNSTDTGWSQYQQRQLEWALNKYQKYSPERWENVAKAVPGKNTEECVERCKELFVTVRKRKMDSTVSQ